MFRVRGPAEIGRSDAEAAASAELQIVLYNCSEETTFAGSSGKVKIRPEPEAQLWTAELSAWAYRQVSRHDLPGDSESAWMIELASDRNEPEE